MGRPFRAVAITATLLLAACGAEPAGDGAATEAVPAPDGPPIRAEGPLGPVVMAAGVDRTARPVGPALAFSPTIEEIAAVVSVADVPAGETLTIAWNRVITPDRRERLFEHSLTVEPFTRAYSVGVSPGEFEEGNYETVATLGDYQAWTPWVVRAGAGLQPPETRRRVTPSFRLVGLVAQAASADGTGPPEAGDTGTVEWLEEEPGADSGAGADGSGSCRFNFFEEAIFGRIDVSARELVPEICGHLVVEASAGGAPQVVARGVGEAYAKVDPCDLEGGSNLPGATVKLVASEIGGGPKEEAVVTLQSLGQPPVVVLLTDPPSGSIVRPGQTISWRLGALQMPFAPGIRSAEVRGPEGVLYRTPEREQVPCDPELFLVAEEGTYVVSSDPPPLIELTGYAEDFEGKQSQGTAFFGTEDQVWEGSHIFELQGHPTTEAKGVASVGLSIAADGAVNGRMQGMSFSVDTLAGLTSFRNYTCEIRGRREGSSITFDAYSCTADVVPFSVELTVDRETATWTGSAAYVNAEINLRCTTCAAGSS